MKFITIIDACNNDIVIRTSYGIFLFGINLQSDNHYVCAVGQV